ncbi:hypothetical protein [Microbacterium sp. MPKO10]|uniref:hypothetical protein n=1 Tax=Microbacterium sp. MPKO10 TaxID=2989818 RepID=UPI002235A484|nr:hypothetical protein [Microbacterium sp. MPKO10]MCW4457098.1 hypothetical protein [Microbacterium sp. MPKO10]
MERETLGDIATWVGSIGTIAAFIVAFMQIHRERSERHRREHREWIAHKRVHADNVSAWVANGQLRISNESRHPIHDVDVTMPPADAVHVDHVLPGGHRQPASGMADGPAAVLEFTDVRGDRWAREAGGTPRLITDAHRGPGESAEATG